MMQVRCWLVLFVLQFIVGFGVVWLDVEIDGCFVGIFKCLFGWVEVEFVFLFGGDDVVVVQIGMYVVWMEVVVFQFSYGDWQVLCLVVQNFDELCGECLYGGFGVWFGWIVNDVQFDYDVDGWLVCVGVGVGVQCVDVQQDGGQWYVVFDFRCLVNEGDVGELCFEV